MSLFKTGALAISAFGVLGVAGAGTAHASGDLFGAIVVGPNHAGTAFDYPSQDEADQAAIAACRGTVRTLGCQVQVRFKNGCGVLLQREIGTSLGVGGTSVGYFPGSGPTAAAAEQDAWERARRENALDSPLVVVIKPLFVLDTACTSNAR